MVGESRMNAMWTKAMEVWLLVLAFALVNGALRVAVLIPALGEYAGHVISTLALAAAVLILTWMTVRWIGVDSAAGALKIGTVWVVCTLTFEFIVGHYVFKAPWEKLLADYDLHAGRVWVLVVVVTYFAPLWAFSQRHPA